MPLTLVETGVTYTIQKICGNEKQRHYIETLGFIEGVPVQILSRFPQYYL
ncbi:MAG: ferrous iron transport protein A [Lachnospiraceae bacterium]|nr:ferrous iron transport protein A [Lachnospiraceae bacterium]